jgi:uncharacterized membrane protein
MIELIFVIFGVGFCCYMFGFVGRIFKTNDKQVNDDYKQSHQEFGSSLFKFGYEIIKPLIAFILAIVFVGIYIIASTR